MTSLPPPSGDMEKLFAKLTECIVFLDKEGYCITADDLIDIREGFRALEADHKAMHDWIRKHSCEKSCEKDRDPNCYSCQSWNFLESLLIKP